MVIDSVIDEKQQHHDSQRESVTDHDHRETSIISVTDCDDHREASMVPETGSLLGGSNNSTN